MSDLRTTDRSGILEGVIWQQLLLFFWPILIGTFFQQLYNTVDAVIVGNVVGKEALAAVGGATGVLVNLLVGFFIGLSSGATVIISQHYGAGDGRRVSSAVHCALALAVLFGAALTVFGMTMTRTLMRLMGTPEDVMPYAISYLRIIFGGMIPLLIYNMGTGVLRAVGDSRHPLYYLAAACMTNIVLDLLLVAGLHLGTVGAALATVLSQCLSAALVMHKLMTTDDATHVELREIRLHRSVVARILRIGLPAGMQSVMYSASNVIIQAAVNSISVNVVAAWAAYGRLDGLFWMIINAFGISVTTFSGQNWGAGRPDRVRRAARECGLMTFVTTVFLAVIFSIFGGRLLHLFTADEQVIAEGRHLISLLVPFFVTYIPIEMMSGTLRGTGDTLIPVLMTLVGVCLVRFIWILGIVPHLGRSIDLIVACYPITWIATSIFFFIYYFRFSPFMKAVKALRAKEAAK